MRDWRVGMIKNPTVPLAVAVAASSAFPPFLSPTILHLKPSDFEPGTGDYHKHPSFRTRVVLSDGGVYDNLGLETLKRCKTVLVSNAGGRMLPKRRVSFLWPFQAVRVLDVIDNQVRSLRLRSLMESLGIEGREAKREGAYWSIRGDFQAGPPEERQWWQETDRTSFGPANTNASLSGRNARSLSALGRGCRGCGG
jgi:NTE family protein